MAKAPTPSTSKTSTTAVVGYPVHGPPPCPLPPHHRPEFSRASVEQDDLGKFLRIPLVDTDPFGFERKRRGMYRCKYCHSEKVSLSA